MFWYRGEHVWEKNTLISADRVLVKVSSLWMLDTFTFQISLTISDTREGWLNFVEANVLLYVFVTPLSFYNEVTSHTRVKSSTNRPGFFQQSFQANNKELLKQSIPGLLCGFRYKRVSNEDSMASSCYSVEHMVVWQIYWCHDYA